MAGKFLKGAFVQLNEAFLLPVPNVILFQYNPESITHSCSPAGVVKQDDDKGAQGNPLSVSGFPSETFSFKLQLDAHDQIAEGNPLVAATGIGPRLAALEVLVHPGSGYAATLVGSVSASFSAGGGSVDASASADGMSARSAPAAVVPTVLFVWGAGRILPVRVTSLVIEEQLWDEALTPMHAEVQVELSVLTPEELVARQITDDPLAVVGMAAYAYTHVARLALATANQANSVESIISMLPL